MPSLLDQVFDEPATPKSKGSVLDQVYGKEPDQTKTATTAPRADTAQIGAYTPTIGQRASDAFRSLRTSGPVEAVLGKTPEETAQMLQPRPTGLIPNVVKAAKDIPKVAELSPGDLFPEQTTLLGAAGKEALSQVNLENLAMLTGIGEIWKAAKLAKDTPKLAALSKSDDRSLLRHSRGKRRCRNRGAVGGRTINAGRKRQRDSRYRFECTDDFSAHRRSHPVRQGQAVHRTADFRPCFGNQTTCRGHSAPGADQRRNSIQRYSRRTAPRKTGQARRARHSR